MIGNFEEHLACDFFENSVLGTTHPLAEANWKKVYKVYNVVVLQTRSSLYGQ